jgi:hypothetical protein
LKAIVSSLRTSSAVMSKAETRFSSCCDRRNDFIEEVGEVNMLLFWFELGCLNVVERSAVLNL